MVVGWWLKCTWILEQPGSSLMMLHPRAVQLQSLMGVYRLNQFLGSFGHWCPKLCSFYSNKFLSAIGLGFLFKVK